MARWHWPYSIESHQALNTAVADFVEANISAKAVLAILDEKKAAQGSEEGVPPDVFEQAHATVNATLMTRLQEAALEAVMSKKRDGISGQLLQKLTARLEDAQAGQVLDPSVAAQFQDLVRQLQVIHQAETEPMVPWLLDQLTLQAKRRSPEEDAEPRLSHKTMGVVCKALLQALRQNPSQVGNFIMSLNGLGSIQKLLLGHPKDPGCRGEDPEEQISLALLLAEMALESIRASLPSTLKGIAQLAVDQLMAAVEMGIRLREHALVWAALRGLEKLASDTSCCHLMLKSGVEKLMAKVTITYSFRHFEPMPQQHRETKQLPKARQLQLSKEPPAFPTESRTSALTKGLTGESVKERWLGKSISLPSIRLFAKDAMSKTVMGSNPLEATRESMNFMTAEQSRSHFTSWGSLTPPPDSSLQDTLSKQNMKWLLGSSRDAYKRVCDGSFILLKAQHIRTKLDKITLDFPKFFIGRHSPRPRRKSSLVSIG